MKNLLNKKGLLLGSFQMHVNPPPILLIKRNIDTKSEKYYVKIKLCRNPMLEKSNM